MLATATGWTIAASEPTPAPVPATSAPPAHREAAAACERAAQETLRDTRGAAAPATFSASPTFLPGAADAVEITLRGAGRLRTAANGTQSFSYSCTYDTRAATVTGVVLRDAGAPARTPQPSSVEPDLSHLSPVACESAAASALKQRWPNVTELSFTADTRQLSQDSSGIAHLRGQGRARPSMRDPATYFNYECQIDARNGRVLGLRLAD